MDWFEWCVGVDEAGDDHLSGDVENIRIGWGRHVSDRHDLVVCHEQVSLNERFVRLEKVTPLDQQLRHVLNRTASSG